MKVFAAFIIAHTDNGIAATTRAADRIGLPGGKLDPGETPARAARREAREEGWHIPGQLTLIHTAVVDGHLVAWLAATKPATPLTQYKERYRGIRPVVLSPAAVAATGYGNDAAMAAWHRHTTRGTTTEV